MIKNLYEVFDLFSNAATKEQRLDVLRSNDSKLLRNVLVATYDPQYQFYYDSLPKEYKSPDTLPGIRPAGLETEFRRLYLFQKGNPTADALSEEHRLRLFVLFLEAFEKREAELVVKMMKKNLGIPQLTSKLIKEAFPGLLP